MHRGLQTKIHAALIVLAALSAAGCDWWPYDARYDPWRCDPLCAGGRLCHEGVCQVPDAGLDTDLPPVDFKLRDGWIRDRPPVLDQASAPIQWTVKKISGPDVNFTDVWWRAAAEVFIVGDLGQVYRFDGTSLTTIADYKLALNAVWADSARVVAGGAGIILWSTDTKNWSSHLPLSKPIINDLWGPASTSVVAVSNMGIWRQGSAKWSIDMTAPFAPMNSVHGKGAKLAIAVGPLGAILTHTETDLMWNKQTSGTTKDLYGVWAFAAQSAWAVGAGGTILRYDGKKWKPRASGTTKDLYGVWGSSNKDIYAVGAGGTILHWDGNSWSKMASNTAVDLRAVSGGGAGDVYVVGDKLTLLHGHP